MSFFLAFASALLSYYLVQAALFCVGLNKMPPKHTLSPHDNDKKEGKFPFVSIIVAVRNEEHNIARALSSLVKIEYPKECLEIIISDGGSTDKTCEIVEAFSLDHPLVKLHQVDLERPIRGKANAVHQAVEISAGEFIFLTDADCIVQPTWVKETLPFFTAETGLVCGITIPKELLNTKRDTWFSEIQSLDWCYILGISSGRANLGYPIGGIGNNLAFRKKTYEEIGGYAKIKFSITEDFALFQAILRSRWKISFPLLYETHNFTEPMQTIRELYEQKKRWTLGGLDASPMQSFLVLLMFLSHVVTIMSFFMLSSGYAFLFLLIKFLSDLLVILPVLIRLREKSLIKSFFYFELYYYAYVFIVPIIILFQREVKWKGVRYDLSKAH